MILRSLSKHVHDQNWFAVFLDFLIVIVGVYIGIQLGNWNEARAAKDRRAKINAAMLQDLEDAQVIGGQIARNIQTGLERFETAYEAGEKPPPFYFRISGSDTAPDIWSMLQQEGLTDLFDPTTVFDMTFYYSESAGVGRKYIRYIEFVEQDILPKMKQDSSVFYAPDSGDILPIYAANMDRLAEFADEIDRLTNWADCLTYRIEVKQTFDGLCSRVDFVLPGMAPGERE